MLPVLAVLALFRDVGGLLVLVLETSAVLAGLGLLVEALVDKTLLERPPGPEAAERREEP